jgi:hypothetical protein
MGILKMIRWLESGKKEEEGCDFLIGFPIFQLFYQKKSLK